MAQKIYSERQILTGVLIGGALAGGYFLWSDLKALGKDSAALVVAVGSIVITIATFGVLFLIPQTQRVPTFLIPAIQIGLAYGITRGYMGFPRLQNFPLHSWGRSLLIAIGFLFLTVIPIFSIVSLRPELFETTKAKNYGDLQHEAQFDSSNISEPEVDQIAHALISAGFFDEEQRKTIDVARSGNRYILTIYCNDSIRTDHAATAPFVQLRNQLQTAFPNHKVTLNLVIGTPYNLVKTIE